MRDGELVEPESVQSRARCLAAGPSSPSKVARLKAKPSSFSRSSG